MATRGRRASVRYYASKGGYFTHFEGNNIRLADGPDDAPKVKTYLAALARFQGLMQVSSADTAGQGNTVRVVVDLYGKHLERNGLGRSLEIVRQACTSAVAEFGDKTFQGLKPVHVTDWLAKMAKPRDTGKHKGVKWGGRPIRTSPCGHSSSPSAGDSATASSPATASRPPRR